MSLLFIDNWFNNAFIQALGWTLFHSLWQGFLLVVLVSLAIVVTKRSSATIRYRIFSSLFFIFIGTTLCTFIIEFSSLRSIPTPSLLTGNEFGDTLTLSTNTHTAAVDLKVPLPGRLVFYFNEYGPWLMLLWFIVFMLKSIRLGINYAQVQRIRNEKPYLLPAIEKRVNELAKLLRIRRKVILRETTSITVPITIGFLKPLILIPCGLINNLPADQVEAILLHELAHIKRLDYLVNLLQCLAETIFFFNPAVLWLSSLLREERENCCDDIAISVTQNKSLFIHALVAFQEYHTNHPMAPGLQGNKYPLLKRIQRIVYNNNKKLNHMEKIFLAAGLVVTGIVALAFTTPATHKKNKPDTNTGIAQKFQPTFSANKDSVPEQRIETGSINTTIDGKKYKVLIKDDKPIGLYIDEKQVPGSELENHHVIMEKIMEEGRAKFFKDRKNDQEAKQWLDLYDTQARQSQKRSEEELLLEKLSKEQNQEQFWKEPETKADLDRKMKLFQDDAKGNELFNQQKKMELQEKFMKELQDDKTLSDLKKENFPDDVQYDKKTRLFKGDLEKNYQLILRYKMKGEDDEKMAKELMLQFEKQETINNKNKKEADQQFYLQKGEMDYERLLQYYKDQSRDTLKPGKRDRKEKTDRDEAEYERKREELQEQKEKMNNRMKERNEDYKERMEKMNEYRAMLKKELNETEKNMDKEKKDLEKERNNKREMNDKESTNEERAEMKERDAKRRGELTARTKEAGERRKQLQNEMLERRKEQQKEMDGRRKEQRAKMDERRKEIDKERKERRAELIKSLKDDGIIANDVENVSIQINDDGMIVNGVKQPENVFKKYREKMGKKPTQPSEPKPAVTPL